LLTGDRTLKIRHDPDFQDGFLVNGIGTTNPLAEICDHDENYCELSSCKYRCLAYLAGIEQHLQRTTLKTRHVRTCRFGMPAHANRAPWSNPAQVLAPRHSEQVAMVVQDDDSVPIERQTTPEVLPTFVTTSWVVHFDDLGEIIHQLVLGVE
jgi:hypothetical protein